MPLGQRFEGDDHTLDLFTVIWCLNLSFHVVHKMAKKVAYMAQLTTHRTRGWRCVKVLILVAHQMLMKQFHAAKFHSHSYYG